MAEVEFQIEEDFSPEKFKELVQEVELKEIFPGQIVKGRIIGVDNPENPQYVILSLGSKYEGKIPYREFDTPPQENEEIEALVKKRDEKDSLFLLSKRELERKQGWMSIQEAYKQDLPIVGVIKKVTKNGYVVSIKGVYMFLPKKEVGKYFPRKPIGTTHTFKVLSIDEKKKRGILSRKKWQEEEDERRWENFTKKYQEGDVVRGKPVRYSKNGVWVEVEGIHGFLSKEDILWNPPKRFSLEEILPLHEETEFRILSLDPQGKKLLLGKKQLTEDPWKKVLSKIQVGDVVEGKVTFVTRFGAFVDLGEGVEGLLHVSEMDWTRIPSSAREVVQEGDTIKVKVLGINPEAKRISLGLRQLTPNPWDHWEEWVKIGEIREGEVKDVTDFGVFVSLKDNIDCLIKKEEIRWEDPPPNPRKLFKRGDKVKYQVIEVKPEEGRIAGSIKNLLPNPYEDLAKKYPPGSIIEGSISGVVDFGIFVRFDKGFEGLVHVSRMPRQQAKNHRSYFKKGDPIQAVVVRIIPQEKKIVLSLKELEEAMEKQRIKEYLASEEIGRDSPFKDLLPKVLKKESKQGEKS